MKEDNPVPPDVGAILRLFVPVALKPSGHRTYPIDNFKGLRIDT